MFRKELETLRNSGLARNIKDRESPQGARIILDGRHVLNFSSNDYLGLANHPEIIEASAEAMRNFGYGSGSSRLLGGGTTLHRELEDRIAAFKGTESALVFNSGYSANTGIIPAIAREGDVIFSDELNHASIADGCRLSRAKRMIYRHKETGHLNELINRELSEKAGLQGRLIIITDSVFSMDGDIAPLNEIYSLCVAHSSGLRNPDSLLLYIDEAHATGVLGAGRGSLAAFNISPEPWIIQMGTFSKALGSFGAFIAGSSDIIDWVTNTARSLIFSTALPACTVAASLRAIELVEEEPGLVTTLWSRREMLASLLREAGCDTGESRTPIIPVMTDNIEQGMILSDGLLEMGIYAPAIRPPSVRSPRIRISVTAGHSEEDIRSLAEALKKLI